jgi:hypothetical protein
MLYKYHLLDLSSETILRTTGTYLIGSADNMMSTKSTAKLWGKDFYLASVDEMTGCS